jgi:hypothetical protein
MFGMQSDFPWPSCGVTTFLWVFREGRSLLISLFRVTLLFWDVFELDYGNLMLQVYMSFIHLLKTLTGFLRVYSEGKVRGHCWESSNKGYWYTMQAITLLFNWRVQRYFIIIVSSASENNDLVLTASLKFVLFTGFISFSIKNGTCAISHRSNTSQKSRWLCSFWFNLWNCNGEWSFFRFL